MLLFFLVWKLELIPVYLLPAIWGQKRQYAATKFILYTAGVTIYFGGCPDDGVLRRYGDV